ncbi:MAG: carbohydrate kinase [Rhizobiaceae bacterium]
MILCCGEALIDMLPVEIEQNGGEFGYCPVPGGAIFNTAIALARLGSKTALVGGVSDDLFGRQLIDAMEKSGVDTRFCFRSDLPTPLAFVALSKGKANYTFYDQGSAMRMFQANQLSVPDENITALQFGGICLLEDPAALSYEKLLMRMASKSVIALDPNIRPNFVIDEDCYRARLLRMIAASDIIKLSDEDFLWLYPEASFEEMASEWVKLGAALVIQTLGGKGSMAITRRVNIRVATETIEVVDTVGAGDAYNAGLLYQLETMGLLSKKMLKDISETNIRSALEFASKVAAYTVKRAGANPPYLGAL